MKLTTLIWYNFLNLPEYRLLNVTELKTLNLVYGTYTDDIINALHYNFITHI